MTYKEIITVEFSYPDLIEKIKTGERFDFSRFGDGEMNAIFQDSGRTQNCDAHHYFPTLGKALLNVLKDSPDYYLGLQSLAFRQRPAQIEQITKDNDLKWCNSNILHHANIHGRIRILFEALESRDVLLVGPQHLHKLAVKHNWYFTEIPHVNCWTDYEKTRDEINAIIDHREYVVVYCASMMTNVLIHDFAGRATQVDMGSVLDPYAGVKSRRYHFNLNV